MATLTKGKTFANGETVTPQKLHELVDLGGVEGIVNADIAAGAAIADTKLAQITTANKVAQSAVVNLTTDLAGKAAASHTHDDRYYTESEVNALLAGKLGTTATAAAATKLATARTINGVAFDGSANITIATGTIPVSQGGTGATTASGALTNLGAAAASHTHSAATASAAGFMSAADKTKLDGISAESRVPAGAVLPFAMNSVPTGWLAANGAAVSRTTYSALFGQISTTYGAGDGSTTFNLPDLRGYFVRGAGTNSDGTASGTFGTKQADAFQGHIHTSNGKTGSLGSDANGGGGLGIPFAGVSISTPVSDGTNGTPRTASETRPKNIAMLYCIKF